MSKVYDLDRGAEDQAEASNVDKVFAEERARPQDFKFGPEVAAVFDDMINRSVPFYGEIQRMSCEMAADFAVPGSNLYDLGCATGTTFIALDQMVDPGVRFVGFDNSNEMLTVAREKLADVESRRAIELVNRDLNGTAPIEDGCVAMLILTLQFVRPLYRERVIRQIYEGLRENGALILVEKVTGSNTMLNRLFIEHYYDYKRRNDYSDLEISQKRESLENVLIPYHHEENRGLLLDSGFRHVEEFFRWYNFSAVVAVK